MDVNLARKQVKNWRRELDFKLGELKSLKTRQSELISDIDFLKKQVIIYEKAGIVLNSIGKNRQDSVQRQVEVLVTKGLQTVIDEQLSFHIIQANKESNSTNVSFIIRTTLDDGRTIDTDVLTARGGGVVVVVSFLLRLVVLLLSRHNKDTPIVLDESFSHLSKEYSPMMAEFIKELVEKTGIQIILITHQKEFTYAADRVYHYSMSNGETQIEEWSE